jgi:phosphate transport system substrate-binding protein
MKRFSVYLVLGIIILLSGCQDSPPASNPQTVVSQPSASIVNKGSDTMVNLALAWAESYEQIYPNISISVTGGGSGTGLAALINGTVDIANVSRQISADETNAAEANGITPVEFVTARDAIAVIVNPNNPINELTLEQISKIYKGEINNWQELGGENRPIVRLSRETNSGTHVYFLQTVIRLGNSDDTSIFSADTLLLPSSEGIISEVRDNPNAIGYDGLGYVTSEVKVIAVAHDVQSPYVLPSVATVSDGSYPISRDLYMYTKGRPVGAIKNYLDWILLPEAQNIVTQLGFVPITK